MEIGERHGRLVCIGKDPDKDYRYYLYKCDCGNVKSIIQDNVKRGATISCGCYHDNPPIPSHLKHGLSHTRIDHIYKTIIARCYYPSNNRDSIYGGRGIVMCDEWKNDFIAFKNWAMKNGYSDNLSIDRIDVNGNYEPANCRWITMAEQQRNKRNNKQKGLENLPIK